MKLELVVQLLSRAAYSKEYNYQEMKPTPGGNSACIPELGIDWGAEVVDADAPGGAATVETPGAPPELRITNESFPERATTFTYDIGSRVTPYPGGPVAFCWAMSLDESIDGLIPLFEEVLAMGGGMAVIGKGSEDSPAVDELVTELLSNEFGVTKSRGAKFQFPVSFGQFRLLVLAKPALMHLLAKLDISISRLAKGLGRSMVRLDMVESLLPSFTVQDGPPTATVASRAATDNTSTQDTIPGQAFSSSPFAASITS
nr:hypothetical protein Ccrd_000414 [Ipomoea batatas]